MIKKIASIMFKTKRGLQVSAFLLTAFLWFSWVALGESIRAGHAFESYAKKLNIDYISYQALGDGGGVATANTLAKKDGYGSVTYALKAQPNVQITIPCTTSTTKHILRWLRGCKSTGNVKLH